jgi:Prion-inhibition and propagation
MEPVSFSLGAVGLVGTFVACVDCFEYIRIGRSLGTDYQTAIVKLDLARLRLTRWGRSVGIVQGDQDIDEAVAVTQLKTKLNAPEKDFETVTNTLGQLLVLFKMSAERSKRLSRTRSNEVVDNTIDDADIRFLHERMQDLTIQRQKRSSMLQKTSWALYKKKDFTNLVDHISSLTSALVEVAPVRAQQQELCRAEVREISSDRSLVVLNNILAESASDEHENDNLDDLMHEIVVEAMDERRGTIPMDVWKRNQVGEGSKIQQGDQISGDYRGQIPQNLRHHIAEDNKFGNNVTFLQGNRYG